MDIINKNRSSFWVILLLVVLNISTLTMLWINQVKGPKPPPRIENREQNRQTLDFIQKELELTDIQISKYDQLRRKHARQTRPLIHKIHQLKKEMMEETLKSEPDTTKAFQIAETIGKTQVLVEKITFEHFIDLKALVGENRIGQLHGLLNEFFRKNRPPGHKPSPPQP